MAAFGVYQKDTAAKFSQRHMNDHFKVVPIQQQNRLVVSTLLKNIKSNWIISPNFGWTWKKHWNHLLDLKSRGFHGFPLLNNHHLEAQKPPPRKPWTSHCFIEEKKKLQVRESQVALCPCPANNSSAQRLGSKWVFPKIGVPQIIQRLLPATTRKKTTSNNEPGFIKGLLAWTQQCIRASLSKRLQPVSKIQPTWKT